jgi:hypothetical protein
MVTDFAAGVTTATAETATSAWDGARLARAIGCWVSPLLILFALLSSAHHSWPLPACSWVAGAVVVVVRPAVQQDSLRMVGSAGGGS